MSEEMTQTAEPAGKAIALKGRGGLVGVKAGMTQVYGKDGQAMGVTVVSLVENRVVQVKDKSKHGYSGVQVGLLTKAEKNATKAELGHVAKAGLGAFKELTEFRVEETDLAGIEVGDVLSPDFVKEGDYVDVTAVSKGKGFQGVMKRHNFGGLPATHGVSVSHRAPGSIGNRADPSKVFKGKKMAGQMGNKKVTQQNIRVVAVDRENGFLLLNGSVPGAKSGLVTIRRAVKA